jgi:RHS repeat-associated protein
VSYNARGLQDTIVFQNTTGTALASEQFQYNANLRPITTTATWQSGSGLTGNIFTQNRSYDPGGNVTSLSTTQSAVTGQSGSGGSILENYCYDEQDRLVWAGNSGSQPGSGNGTCGSATLANSISGAAYSNGFVHTNLGSTWQGPLKGSATQYQYLYCDSAHPHQLTGVYTAGTTCATKNDSNKMYSTAYDAWGNVTGRYLSGTTATLSYDALDQLVQWDAGSSSREWYIYDASGNRALRRVTNGSGSSLIVYAFGLEELHYDGTGSNQSNIYYYSLGGRLLGSLDNNGTHFFFTDALGSVLSSVNVSSGAASLQGIQGFGPYGNTLYQQGDVGTARGYTGQYTDSNTGLDFYNARYYDPAIGRFLSADPIQGNLQGTDPYSYVGENPETRNDPTGYCDFICDVGHFFRDVGHTVTHAVNNVTHWFNQESHFAQQVGEQVAKQAAKVLPKWVIPVVVAVVVVTVVVWHAVTGATQKAQPPKNHPWTPNAQRSLAHQTAQQVHDHRQAQYGGKGDNSKTSFGRASISATDNDGNVIDKSQSGFFRGDNKLSHTEQAQAIWVKNELQTRYKNTPAGSTINIMIFTQSYPCAQRCQPGLPRWIQDIKNSAPKGVFVNVYVWYQPTFDKDNALGNPPTSDQDVSPYNP